MGIYTEVLKEGKETDNRPLSFYWLNTSNTGLWSADTKIHQHVLAKMLTDYFLPAVLRSTIVKAVLLSYLESKSSI